jgi:hypothetical protein
MSLLTTMQRVVHVLMGSSVWIGEQMKLSGASGGLHRNADGLWAHCVFAKTIGSSMGTASPHSLLSDLLMFVICEWRYVLCALSPIDVYAP